jgi:hypothetical protein
MKFLMLVLLLLPLPVCGQDFFDVLPEDDYQHIRYSNVKAWENIKLETTNYSRGYSYRVMQHASTGTINPGALEKFYKYATEYMVVTRPEVTHINEEVYSSAATTAMKETNRFRLKKLVYIGDDDEKKIAEFNEFPDGAVLMKITSLKELVKAGILEKEKAGDLKKGAIIGYGFNTDISQVFIYQPEPGILVFTSSKNDLKPYIQVKEGHLPPFRGTASERFIHDRLAPGFSTWEFINNKVRVSLWLEACNEKLVHEGLIEAVQEAAEWEPEYLLQHYSLTDEYKEHLVRQFKTVQAAQKVYNQEKAENDKEYRLFTSPDGKSAAFEKSPLDKIKMEFVLASNSLITSMVVTQKDIDQDKDYHVRLKKKYDEEQRKFERELKEKYPEKYKEYMKKKRGK